MKINDVYKVSADHFFSENESYCIIRKFDRRTVSFSVPADDQPDDRIIIFNDGGFTISRPEFETLFTYCGQSPDGRLYRRAI